MNFCGLALLSHTSGETCLVIQGTVWFFPDALVNIFVHGLRAIPWYLT